MNGTQIAELQRQLFSKTPVLGAIQRRRSAATLASDGSPEAVRLLAEAVVRTNDAAVRSTALKALDRVNDQSCVDAVCGVWALTRNSDLVGVVIAHGWIASSPLDARVLTTLLAQNSELLADCGPEAVLALLRACDDADSSIADRARELLCKLNDPDAQAEVCRLAMDDAHPAAVEAVKASGYQPDDAVQRVVLGILIERWEDYDAFDSDHSMIRQAYQQADGRLRKRIAEKIRQFGRVDLLESVIMRASEFRYDETTDAEWTAALEIVSKREQWLEMWRIAREAPPFRSAEIIKRLERTDWKPEPDDEQELFKRLTQLAKGCDGKPEFWRLVRCRKSVKAHDGPICAARLAPGEEALISCGYDDRIRLWSTDDGERLAEMDESTGRITKLAISPDGSLTAGTGHDPRIHLWGLPDLSELAVFEDYWNYVTDLVISPDGSILAAGGADGLMRGMVRWWSLPGGEELGHPPMLGHGVTALAVSPDSRLLAVGDMGKTLRLWPLKEGRGPRTLSERQGRTHTLAFSPDGKFLAGGVDSLVCVWSIAEGRMVNSLAGQKGTSCRVWFTPDGKTLLSLGSDQTVRMWSLPGGEPLTGEKGIPAGVNTTVHPSFSFTAGTASRSGRGIEFRSLPDGKLLSKVKTRSTGAITFSRDGKTMVTTNNEGMIEFWVSQLEDLITKRVEKITQEDLEHAREALEDQSKQNKSDQAWVEFTEALVDGRRRFDIEVTEAPPSPGPGPADVEIDEG